ncbi:MAG: Rpn family recombination-promoting nuclease/putative transposase, partial [Rickettsiales bacterium]|nr:Rpn family recombination-promoting nuclease/putative transposase [Rickettsiales bacterium]
MLESLTKSNNSLREEIRMESNENTTPSTEEKKSRGRLLKPSRDFIFKHLFGLEGQEERLLSLVNAILGG